MGTYLLCSKNCAGARIKMLGQEQKWSKWLEVWSEVQPVDRSYEPSRMFRTLGFTLNEMGEDGGTVLRKGKIWVSFCPRVLRRKQAGWG